jgi:beta-glucosidase
MDYLFGYRLYDSRAAGDTPVNLVFPFGWGLSYTTFSYSNLQMPCADTTQNGVVYATVDITNTGPVDGEEVAMMFVAGPPPPAGTTGERNVKELKSFAKVAVPAGQTVTATLPLRIQDLRHWEGGATGQWVIDPGEYTILVGPNAGPAGNVTDFPVSGTLTVSP